MNGSITFALAGNLWSNSRALRQLELLAALVDRIDVISLSGATAPVPIPDNVRVTELSVPAGSGPVFFRRIHRIVLDAARKTDSTVYHASDLYVLPAMAKSAHKKRRQVVYDARELYPFVAATEGRPWSRLFWYLTERRYAPKADIVFTVSDSIAARMSSIYGIPRPTVLHNVPPFRTAVSTGYLRTKLGVPESLPIMLHQGQIRPARGCGQLVRAMQDVHNAVLVFLGDGPVRPALEAEVERAGTSDRVRFLDPVPVTDLPAVTASADVGITLLEDTCLNHRYALPNKLFQYLMAGLPVLGSDLPEIRNVIVEHDVGRVVDPSDLDALIIALRSMADDRGSRARWRARTNNVFETFDPVRASEAFQKQYLQLASPPRI